VSSVALLVEREKAMHWVDGYHRADLALGWAAETRKTKHESEAANFEADVMPWRARA
jgi:hypothetical protein